MSKFATLHAMTNKDKSSTETLRDPNHPFRALADRPKKAQKHRYKRRKTRRILKVTDGYAVAVAA